MEIKKNRYGDDRAYEFINHNTVRVYGNSHYVRQSDNADGNIVMYDFEGGPCFNKDAYIKLRGQRMKIVSIEPQKSKHKGLCEVILHLK